MRRRAGTLTIGELRSRFVEIDFPEFQREADVWSREQKQRLIDSILRDFDISAVYLYESDPTEQAVECIDGRQRMNAIMSFLGENDADLRHNAFALRIENEIGSVNDDEFEPLDDWTWSRIVRAADGAGTATEVALAAKAVQQILNYQIAVIYLSEGEGEDFNLQFLRLNLGAIINAGEKLHAMVGRMRNLIFDAPVLGKHPFIQRIGIPKRRFAKEVTAAQVILQAFTLEAEEDFARARHIDLQRFVKENVAIAENDPLVVRMAGTLDALERSVGHLAPALGNRAIAVSVILLAWEYELHDNPELGDALESFLTHFLERLAHQVQAMRRLSPDARYQYLVDFQRHLTQASVEKPALRYRHSVLTEQFERWLEEESIEGD